MSDFYKKIIKNRAVRLYILQLFNWIPDNLMLKMQYRIKTGRKLNLKDPKRYTEKCQWYKLYYHDPLMTRCVDKYTVRSYVKEKGFEHILNELYGVFDKAEDIDFQSLPNRFVMKITSGSGTNIIVKDKSKLDIRSACKTLDKWVQSSPIKISGEWPYYNTKAKIIIEKYLESKESSLIDYKFFCFNGQVSHSIVISDRFSDEKIDLYDRNWNRMKVIQSDCPNQSATNMERPKNYEEMLRIAEELSKDFPHVRVDLYNINGKIIFGELTFFSGSGYYQFTPDEFDFILGDKFVLPNKMYDGDKA